jgi:acylphosphatase
MTLRGMWVLSGRVQGVGFRWFARERARALSLAGWVRNLPDGAVEVAAEGAADALASFEAALRSGPPGAHVQSMAVRQIDDTATLPQPFTIVRP